MSTPEQKYEQWFRETKVLYDEPLRPPIDRKKLLVRRIIVTFFILCFTLYARDRFGGWSEKSVGHILKGSIYKGAMRREVVSFLTEQENRYWGIKVREYKFDGAPSELTVQFNMSSWPYPERDRIEIELSFDNKQKLTSCSGAIIGYAFMDAERSNPFQCD